MIKKYENMYPMTLWVGLYSDWDQVLKKFNLYYDVGSMNDMEQDDMLVFKLREFSSGCTYLARSKKDNNEKGIIILLNQEYLYTEDYSFLLELVSHECSHATDAVWQVIGEPCHSFDEGNEPRAYLLGWFAGRIGEYLSEYFKNNKDEK